MYNLALKSNKNGRNQLLKKERSGWHLTLGKSDRATPVWTSWLTCSETLAWWVLGAMGNWRCVANRAYRSARLNAAQFVCWALIRFRCISWGNLETDVTGYSNAPSIPQ